jgi:nucleoside-diphosphate kinase
MKFHFEIKNKGLYNIRFYAIMTTFYIVQVVFADIGWLNLGNLAFVVICSIFLVTAVRAEQLEQSRSTMRNGIRTLYANPRSFATTSHSSIFVNILDIQNTLAIIKPDAMRRDLFLPILHWAAKAGLSVVRVKTIWLDPHTICKLYAEHVDAPWFDEHMHFMGSGPSSVVILRGVDAVRVWRKVMGATDHTKAEPGTVRSIFATSYRHNCVHGSDSLEAAAREIHLFFGRTDYHHAESTNDSSPN